MTIILPDLDLFAVSASCNDQKDLLIRFWLGKVLSYSPNSSVKAYDLYKRYIQDITSLNLLYPELKLTEATRHHFYKCLKELCREKMYGVGVSSAGTEIYPTAVDSPKLERRAEGLYVTSIYANFLALSDRQSFQLVNRAQGDVLFHQASSLHLDFLFQSARS